MRITRIPPKLELGQHLQQPLWPRGWLGLVALLAGLVAALVIVNV